MNSLVKNRITRNLYKTANNLARTLRYKRLQHNPDIAFIKFLCNICGKFSTAPKSEISGRENPSCCYCGSTLRFRTVIHALSMELFGKSYIIKDFPPVENVYGIGMSDEDLYARLLSKKIIYLNTFYHKEPRIDITDIPPEKYNKYDYIITSDVFEHIRPPVEESFSNLFNMLKSGGVCIFSVPYRNTGQTIEHFPELFEYKFVKNNGNILLHNVTRKGQIQVFDNLRFHGGHGTTLEMRVFSKQSLIKNIKEAGFVDIKPFNIDVPEYGIIYEEDELSQIFTFRKPMTLVDP